MVIVGVTNAAVLNKIGYFWCNLWPEN